MEKQPDFDLDEDLFDFAAVAQEPEAPASDEELEEIFASFRDAPQSEELLSRPVDESLELELPAAPLPSAPPAPLKVVQAQEAPRPKLASLLDVGRDDLAVPASRPARKARLSKNVLLIALAVTLLNSGLAVVVLNRNGVRRDEVRADDDAAQPATLVAGVEPESTSPQRSTWPDPERTGTLVDHPTLENARLEIGRGEYASARQHLYGLLSIIDRLDDPRRASVEAECQFLIAQALHLEALERLGGTR